MCLVYVHHTSQSVAMGEGSYCVPYLTNTLRAPSGVTSMAGANPYAAKLAASPAAMVISPTHHNHSLR